MEVRDRALLSRSAGPTSDACGLGKIAIIIVVLILVVGGAFYMAIQDEHGVSDELGTLQSQILDLQKEAAGNPSVARLNQMAVQLGDIRSELSDLPPRHRLAFTLFGNLNADVDEVSNLDSRVTIAVNQKR